ncbi:hypothetical protein EIP86_006270 [Pleurotus ostreatoroseus]|nr:hypothetical protein EIP86_006270 [Pleurotus ostreatoroseus]
MIRGGAVLPHCSTTWLNSRTHESSIARLRSSFILFTSLTHNKPFTFPLAYTVHSASISDNFIPVQMGVTSNAYVDALRSALPIQYSSGVQSLPSPTLRLLDSILRFTSGGECPEDAEKQTQENWKAGQDRIRKVFDGLNAVTTSNGSSKRARDGEGEEEHEAKRSKTQDDTLSDAPSFSLAQEKDDSPQYTLHALSLQAPLRKKLDIVVCKHTLRLINPSSQAVEASIPLNSLKRAFLLNTRGKTKAHWTVVILASDTVAPKATGKAAQAAAAAAAASGEAKPEERQIVFGIDATPAPYATTDHTAADVSRTTHPKGTPILPQLRAFLSHLPIPYVEPDTSVFRSAAPGSDGEPIAGVSAYRAAKEGTLWFLNDGILWDGRPCEYWDVADLVPTTNADEHGSESLRFVSATGKTASVYIRRQVPAAPKAAGSGEDEEEEEGEYVETSFNPVDAKEQDGVVRWVKRRKNLFGIAQRPNGGAAGSDAKGKGKAVVDETKVDVKGKGKAVAVLDEDSDDSDDEDFVDDSGSDGGSPTSSDSEDNDNNGGSDGAEDSGSEEAEDDEAAEDEDEEEGDMDPEHHPLLRAGAMPRMSKSAMNMALGMMNESMFSGAAGGSSRKDAGGKDEAEDHEDEEDELED